MHQPQAEILKTLTDWEDRSLAAPRALKTSLPGACAKTLAHQYGPGGLGGHASQCAEQACCCLQGNVGPLVIGLVLAASAMLGASSVPPPEFARCFMTVVDI